jgi:hypothetical protein
LLPESPRWLIAHDRHDEAREILWAIQKDAKTLFTDPIWKQAFLDIVIGTIIVNFWSRTKKKQVNREETTKISQLVSLHRRRIIFAPSNRQIVHHCKRKIIIVKKEYSAKGQKWVLGAGEKGCMSGNKDGEQSEKRVAKGRVNDKRSYTTGHG